MLANKLEIKNTNFRRLYMDFRVLMIIVKHHTEFNLNNLMIIHTTYVVDVGKATFADIVYTLIKLCAKIEVNKM